MISGKFKLTFNMISAVIYATYDFPVTSDYGPMLMLFIKNSETTPVLFAKRHFLERRTGTCTKNAFMRRDVFTSAKFVS